MRTTSTMKNNTKRKKQMKM